MEGTHDQGTDLGSLDWSAHLMPPERRPIGPGIFLAEAIDRIGRAMIESWHAGVIASVAISDVPPEEVHDPDVAFEKDRRTPVPHVHRVFGPTVRKVLSPGRWESLRLKNEDPAKWLESHRIDPATGQPTPAGELRAAEGKDSSDPITYDNWLTAYAMSTLERGFREAHISDLDSVVMALISLHYRGEISLTAAPGEGAAHLRIDPLNWHGSYGHRMRLIASCMIEVGSDSDADPGRRWPIFVDEVGFDDAVRAYAAAHFVPIISPDHPWFNEGTAIDLDDAMATPKLHAYEGYVRETLDAIEPILSRLDLPGRENWRRADLERLVSCNATLNRFHLAALPEVRARLLKQDRFAFLRRAGQPSKLGRLADLSEDEVRRLIAESDTSGSKQCGGLNDSG